MKKKHIVATTPCLNCGKLHTHAKFCSVKCANRFLRPPGCSRSEETRAKIRLARAKQINSSGNNPEIGKKISQTLKGRIPWNKGLKNDPRMANQAKAGVERMKKMNSNWHKHHTEESIKRTMSVQSPTSIEIKLTKIMDKYGFPFRFVGNGQVMIGRKIPDFINTNHKKQLIEIFSRYWHSLEKTGRTEYEEEQYRINIFKEFGYSTLIIWEDELDNEELLVGKIQKFTVEEI